jgi:hypothetical protein
VKEWPEAARWKREGLDPVRLPELLGN